MKCTYGTLKALPGIQIDIGPCFRMRSLFSLLRNKKINQISLND